MKPTKLPCTITIALVALALTACASNKPIGEWRNQSFTGVVDNILIIGVSSNSERRYTFENKFVAALAANNTRAIASYKILDSSLNLRREIIEKTIEGQQVGAVLITRLVGVRAQEVYSLPDDYDYQRSFYGYYDNALQETNRGTYTERTLLTLETSLYDTASGELIWSMQSERMDASTPRKNIEAQIKLTTETLLNQGLIAGKH